MPDVQILTASSGFKSQDTSTWATVCQIPAGSFTAGDKYLIIATAHSMLNDSAQELQLRLVHGTTPTQFTDAYEADEVLGNKVVGSGFMVQYTQPGTTEAVTLEYRVSTNGVGDNHLIRWAQLVAINLDDIGTQSTDYWYAEDTTDHALTTTPTDGASVTFTPNGTDKYLYIAQVTWEPTDASVEQTFHTLLYDGGVVQQVSEEGEDATPLEQRNRLLVWANTPTNASHTVKVQGRMEAGTSSTTLSSRVFALNLAKFADAHIATPADHQLTALDTWQNAWTTSFTPSASQDYFILSHVTEDYGSDQNPDVVHSLQINPDGNGLYDYPGTVKARDTFTEASTVNLSSHTADSGQSWTQEFQSEGTVRWEVVGSTDVAHIVGGSAVYGTSQSSITGLTLGDGYVEFRLVSGGDGVGVTARLGGTGSSYNGYQLYHTGAAMGLYRVSAGAQTSLGSVTGGSWYRLYVSSESPTQLMAFSASTQATLRTTFTDAGFVPALSTTDSTAGLQVTSGKVGIFGIYDDEGLLGGSLDDLRVVEGGWVNSSPDGGAWDAADETPWTFMDTVPFTSGASRTINYDHRQSSAGTTTRPSILDPVFVAFSKALAGGGPTQYTQALTAAITPAGAAIKSAGKSLAGTLSSAGSLTTSSVLHAVLTAALSFTSAMGRTANRVLDAATATLGLDVLFAKVPAVVMVYQQALTAALGFAGALAKSTSHALAGALSFAGAIARSTTKSLSGSVSPSGALTRTASFLRSLSASLSPAGALARAATLRRAVAGSLGFTGALTSTSVLHLALTATLSFASALGRTWSTVLDASTASLSFLGSPSFVKTVVGSLTQAFTASLTFAGAITRSTSHALAGALTPAGALTRTTARALTAALAPAGALTKSTARALAASLTPAADLAKSTTKLLAGSLTPAVSFTASLVQALAESFSAALSFTGDIAKSSTRTLAATLAPAASLARSTQRALAASLAPAGALTRTASFLRSLTATLAPAASLVRGTQRALTASLAPAGDLARLPRKVLSATLAPAASLVRQTRRALAASLTPGGTFQAQLIGALAASFDAALTFVSALGRQADRVLDAAEATLTPSGGLSASRRVLQALSAALSFAGALGRSTARQLAATLSPSGLLSTGGFFQRALTATLTPAGALATRAGKSFAASLAPAGSLVRRTSRALVASLTPASALVRSTLRSLAASLTPTASLGAERIIATLTQAFAATVTFTVTLNRRTQRAFAATLPTTAQLVRSVRRSIAATLAFAATFGRGRFMSFTASLSFIGAFIGAARTRLASRLPAFARGVGAAFARTRGSTANRDEGATGTRGRGSTSTRE